MPAREYKEGDVIGTARIIIDEITPNDNYVLSVEGMDVAETYDAEEFEALLSFLDPVKRKERIKREIAEKQKELEELEKSS